jgi:hypothetical protein
MQFSFTNFFLIVVYAALSFSDSTESVSVADFKSEFTSSAIVPEVLATFNPSVEFYVGFNSDDGSKGLLTPGLNLSLTEAKAPFELSVANIANATNITSSSRFIVYLVYAFPYTPPTTVHFNVSSDWTRRAITLKPNIPQRPAFLGRQPNTLLHQLVPHFNSSRPPKHLCRDK